MGHRILFLVHYITVVTQSFKTQPSPEPVALVSELAAADGMTSGSWPGLTFFHSTVPLVRTQAVYRPCVCFVIQGRKRLFLEQETLEYDASKYMVVSLPMPMEGSIIEASERRPCMGILLEFDSTMLSRLVLEMTDEGHSAPNGATERGVFTAKMTAPLSTAVTRFLETLPSAMDRRILGPGAVRAILYHVLLGEQGHRLRSLAVADGVGYRVTRIIRYLEENVDQPLDVSVIAKHVGMGTSTLHHAFKRATAMSPIQYLKKLRLHRARALMLGEGLSAREASFRVGYASPSQFSREFKRMFGVPPSRVSDSLLYETPAAEDSR